MKKFVCEMCGNSDLIKKEEYYVCQYCGTKYEPETAKKLMVEVDNSKQMANLYERARKSIEVNDLEHAAEYYKRILDENPNDWEAYFYSYLGEHMSFTNAQAGSVASKLGNTIPSAYDMAIKDCEPEEAEKRLKIITEKTVARLTNIATTGVALLSQYEGGNQLSPRGRVNSDLYQRIRPIAQNTIISCVVAFDSLEKKVKEVATEKNGISESVRTDCLLTICRARYNISSIKFEPSADVKEVLIKAEIIQEYAQKIKDLDPEFKIPEPASTSSGSWYTAMGVPHFSSSGGCYVATAVYGSYDCPQVWTLRRYRDNELAKTWYGRAFIYAYYAISPTIVKLFGDTQWFKHMWKGKLDRMVNRLNGEGFENTPYDDIEW